MADKTLTPLPVIKEDTRIFICGDIHGTNDIHKLNTKSWPEQKNLNRNDLLIQLGDFGFIWTVTPDATEEYWLKWFDKKLFYTLFIPGNHENYERLNGYPEIDFYGGKAAQISEKVFMLKNGYVFNLGGKKFWTFGGADSNDKQWRTEGVSWWREEIPDHDTMMRGLTNLENEDYKVDFILTHTMPRQLMPDVYFIDEGNSKLNDPVAAYLDQILNRMRNGYRHWFCGHFHVDKTLEDHKLTVLYDKVIELKKFIEGD